MPTPAPNAPGESRRYERFSDFYPFYLSEHRNATSRRLHVLGTSIVIVVVLLSLASGRYWGLLVALALGYGLAWAGHFFFEKNRPATFKHPFYSLAADFVMLKDVLARRLPW